MLLWSVVVFCAALYLPNLFVEARMQTVGVKGNFTCGNEPAQFVRLEMICGPYKEVIRHSQTDEFGFFRMAGRKRKLRNDFGMAQPRLRVWPNCNTEQECKDVRFEFPIPETLIYPDQQPFKLHDIGVFDLMQEFPRIYSCEDSKDCKKQLKSSAGGEVCKKI